MKRILLFLLLISQSIVHGQTVEWAFTFGSTSADNAKAIAVDTLGNIYATGEFRGKVDFDPGPGSKSDSRSNVPTTLILPS